MLMLNQGKWKSATKLANIIEVLKRPSLDLSIGSIARKQLLNRKQLERIGLKKHQLVSGTRVFINENLTIKNEHLDFNCRQLKKGTIYSGHLRRMAQFILNEMKILYQ